MEQTLFNERSTMGAVLQLAALNKSDWEHALETILRIDSHVLHVDRTSYWTLCDNPRSLRCELGYIASADAMERGAVLLENEAPTYLGELNHARVLDLDDVRSDPRSRELRDYSAARRITSLLDVPVWSEAKLVGVLCHEHVGPARHFTAAEIDFALAAAQTIATALEARRRTVAEQQERRAGFLSQTTLELAHSLDEDVVARRAVSLALPTLADWAALDFFDGDKVVRKAIQHVDPEKRALLEQYAADYPPLPGSPHMTVQVHQLGQSVVIPNLTDEALRNNQFSDEHIRRVRPFGLRSAMAVPIQTVEFGAVLMLISSGRTYGYDSLKLAEAYAERVASALANARLYRRSQEALHARNDFLMLASHELKTPLTSLRLSCEQLAQSAQTAAPELARSADRILRGGRRLSRLIDHMLDAVGAGRHMPVLERAEVDLVPMVREVVDEASATLRGRAPIELSLPTSLVGRWDGDRLHEVLINLVDNALKFGGDKSILISATADENVVTLSIADRGGGIDPALRARLFEPFERGAANRAHGGLGLGLFLVRAIVDAHGGSIDVHDREGGGSEFVVRLPGLVSFRP